MTITCFNSFAVDTRTQPRSRVSQCVSQCDSFMRNAASNRARILTHVPVFALLVVLLGLCLREQRVLGPEHGDGAQADVAIERLRRARSSIRSLFRADAPMMRACRGMDGRMRASSRVSMYISSRCRLIFDCRAERYRSMVPAFVCEHAWQPLRPRRLGSALHRGGGSNIFKYSYSCSCSMMRGNAATRKRREVEQIKSGSGRRARAPCPPATPSRPGSNPPPCPPGAGRSC